MKNQFVNNKKAVSIGNGFWDKSEEFHLINLIADHLGDGAMKTTFNHQFINMCSYSYLGLDSHPKILEGAIAGLNRAKTLNTSISRIRVRLPILEELESKLTSLFNAETITLASCSAASEAILPLISAGVFTEDVAPIMVFDKNAHFSMNIIKPICADETEVLTSPHNDMNYLEDICKRNKKVAYVADGIYSTGGATPIHDLLELQNKYGLFLYFDEAHSTSICGENGEGYVLNIMNELNKNTVIVSSLNKGFGASGGTISFNNTSLRKIINRFGGPFSWSQRMNTAGIGAALASIEIHKSPELKNLQEKLSRNIELFDSLIDTAEKGDGLPIRKIAINDETKTVEIAKKIFEDGYYTSPLFFPIVGKGKAGLRIMIRADMTPHQIIDFSKSVKNAFHKS